MSSRPQPVKPNQNENVMAKGSKSSSTTIGTTKRGRDEDDGWGGIKNYLEAKRYKLGEQFHAEKLGLESSLFNGVTIYVNGYTNPSSDELRKIIVAHGGKYQMYFSKSRVTHIIATSLPNSKFHQAKSTPVIKPEWITESIKARKCLPHTSYFLFDNKSKLQTGLKSFASVTSLSRSRSTRSSSSVQDSIIPAEDDGNVGKEEIKDNDTNGKIIIDSSTTAQTSFSDSHLNAKSNGLGIQDEKLEIMDKDEDPDSDIVYNSEEEETPQRLKQNLSVLTKRFDSLNSPSNGCSSPKLAALVSRGNFPSFSSESEVVDKPITSHNPLSSTSLLTQVKENPPQKVFPVSSLEKLVTLTSTSTPTALSVKPVSPSKSSTTLSVAKAGDKGFLNEYYSNSRLHHISQWGAEFKAYVADIQLKGDASFPGRVQLHQSHVENAMRLNMAETLKSASHGTPEKTFIHIDMDCFFVSVGLLLRPELRGKPVAVTHSRGQGSKPDPKSDPALEKLLWSTEKDGKLKNHNLAKDLKIKQPAVRNEYDFAIPKGSTGLQTFHSMAEIASCSYEARQRGLKNGMLMGKAKTLCPDLQTIPYDFDEYNRISRILYDIVASFTHDIEAVSCDEMYVDCTDVLSDTGATTLEFANLLRNKVFDKTGCTASVGIGPNILLTRLATKKAKPNGVFQVFKNEAKDFVKDQDVSDLPGVGYSMSSKLTKLGVKTCGDLQSVPVSTLRREFGPKTGESLHRFSLGVDDREVKRNKQRKSVSAEVNYGMRFTQELEATIFLQELSVEVAKRLENVGMKGRSITLKLMIKRPDAPVETAKFMGHGVCNTLTKSSILPLATSDGSLIGKEVIGLYKYHKISAPDIRGIGIQVHKLESSNDRDQQSSGHQSILHFATSKKNMNDTATTSKATMLPTTSILSSNSTMNEGKSNGQEMNGMVDKGFTSHFSNEKNGNSLDVADDLYEEQVALPTAITRMTDVSFLLSPSQVSENVLEELPPDIAQELRSGIEEHKKRKNQAYASSTENNPTSSHQGSENLPSVARRDNVLEDLPSMSQLDMNCFHALPRSLQKELESAYAKQKQSNKAEGKRPSPIKGTALEKLKSPSKDKEKQTRKRRGQPARSRKKLTTGNMVKLKSFVEGNRQCESMQSAAKTNSNQGPKRRLDPALDEVICLDEDSNSKETCNDQDFVNPDINGAFLNQPRVTFCGAYTLKEVRSLLKEWMNSCTEPEENDVIMVTDYLTSLVHHKCLEHAFCLLRFLMRHVHMSLISTLWKECIKTIGAHVQNVVMNIYDAQLKLL